MKEEELGKEGSHHLVVNLKKKNAEVSHSEVCWNIFIIKILIF